MMITFESCNYSKMLKKDLNEFYFIRKKIFKDRLDWLVKCKDGMEFDEYDNENTNYLIGKKEGKIICGCRFIDMHFDNMFTGVFYKYFDKLTLPEGNYVEVTRLFIDNEPDLEYEFARDLKLRFFLNIHAFAKESGYDGIYAVVSEQLLCSLIKAGWNIEVQKIGISEKKEQIYLIIMPTKDIAILCLKDALKNKYA
ncbi:acyl-homoserine-lactone synthase [Pantoea cypripedii]|uniref:Acyl-homoserine-lactone synthase n=1 Tax=Pantoea cypripedii TaxID=55209 RepID=A0A6B9G2B0_PANCY|nr:acyl-homoserine-lactone synthase [Pantoea cypripedii]QGY28820.1 acyl-homoserine-lactone synthase [Pantoea cypripedii]